MAMGECSVYSSLQVDSKVKFAAWPKSWRPLGTDQQRNHSELLQMASAVDDSTINVVVVIIIIIIIIIIKRWILHHTTIYSDCWHSYSTLVSEGYIHSTVNHSVEFKSETGTHH